MPCALGRLACRTTSRTGTARCQAVWSLSRRPVLGLCGANPLRQLVSREWVLHQMFVIQLPQSRERFGLIRRRGRILSHAPGRFVQKSKRRIVSVIAAGLSDVTNVRERT